MEPHTHPHSAQTLALITSYAPSLVNFRAALIRALCARGVRVLALAPNFTAEIKTRVLALGATPIDFPMSRTGMNPVLDFIHMWRLAKVLRQLKPDISLGYFIKPAIFGSMAAKLAGVPRRLAMIEGLGFVFTPGEGGLPLQRRVLKKLVLWLYKLGQQARARVQANYEIGHVTRMYEAMYERVAGAQWP